MALLFLVAGTLGAKPAGTPVPAPPQTKTVLKIDLNGPSKSFPPTFAGLMTEEINHSYDGGLYAELIRNRAFLDNPTNAEAWSIFLPGGAEAVMEVSDRDPLTDKLPKSLEVRITKASSNAPVLIANSGFWGIPVKPETPYKVCFYAKGNNVWEKKKEEPDPVVYRSPLTVSLQSRDGSKVFASADTPPLSGDWQKIELTLSTGRDVFPSKENRFVIKATAPGIVRLSLVSLFPPTYKNRPNGNRPDLMEKLACLRPKFLRFPGGNFLEGDNLSDRYDWKQTRGPLEFRPGHNGCWSYRSSDGLGLLEFMEWCEDLGMEPVLAVFAGYSLKGQHVAPAPLLEPYVQDALDEIEYLTGDAKKTHWGALRARDGHPEPFRLRYVQIGNEDWFDRTGSYDGRYASFHDAIKARYPDLRLIASTPVRSRKPDAIDEHFYMPTEWFVKEFRHYDKTDRNGPKIFVGEWATRSKEDSATPSLAEALGDAAWMCAMERNTDLVIMHCYAPLLVNVNPGASQWKPNLIGYDSLDSFVSPAWHAQALFNTHRGDEVVAADLKGDDSTPEKRMVYSVTRDRAKGLLYVKLVNVQPVARTVKVSLGMDVKVSPEADTVILTSGDPKQVNSIEKPDAVVPQTGKINNASSDFSLSVPPNALMIITLKLIK